MSTTTPGGAPPTIDTAATANRSSRPVKAPKRHRQGLAGYIFIGPVVLLLALFLVFPIIMALWVSVSDWTGQGSPFSGSANFVGADNYTKLFFEDGLARKDFNTGLNNTFFYVLLVVPLQTILALFLALVVNQKLRGQSFFRTAFYFPSVTSSVAISLVFIFLFTGGGAINGILGVFGINGPQWFSDPRGLIHIIGDTIGVWNIDAPPDGLVDNTVGSLTLWDWISGPSVAMSALIMLVVWTTAGTFMLLFLAALQDLPKEVDEAATVDGTTRWQRFRYVTVPQLKPVLFLVITLGLIGTWQVFDQIFIISKGAPAKTTVTPAFLSYTTSFIDNRWGEGTAMAFILFAIIMVMTLIQRYIMRDKDAMAEKRQIRKARGRTHRGSRGSLGEAFAVDQQIQDRRGSGGV